MMKKKNIFNTILTVLMISGSGFTQDQPTATSFDKTVKTTEECRWIKDTALSVYFYEYSIVIDFNKKTLLIAEGHHGEVSDIFYNGIRLNFAEENGLAKMTGSTKRGSLEVEDDFNFDDLTKAADAISGRYNPSNIGFMFSNPDEPNRMFKHAYKIVNKIKNNYKSLAEAIPNKYQANVYWNTVVCAEALLLTFK